MLSDGKAGDEQPCLGVVERMGLVPVVRRIAPRRPYAWFLPRGPVDPRERPGRPGSPLLPPWPDLLVGSGRRAVRYLAAVKAASGGRTFTVCLKDPRTGAGAADLIWVPGYDRLRGPNVVVTLTSPHRLGPERLATARAAPDPRLPGSGRPGFGRPRAAVLVGGDSRHGRFTPGDIDRLASCLGRLAQTATLMITFSRRTPPALAAALAALVARNGGFLWDGTGSNPFASLLAGADCVVVTADSINMLSEAAATAVPVLVARPERLSARHRALADALEAGGRIQPFTGALETGARTPVDSTDTVAAAIAERLAAHRAALKP